MGEVATRPAVDRPPRTRRSRRVAAMAVWAALLAAWTWSFGMPNDTIQVFLWLWLGVVAWDVEAPPRDHLRFGRDWWPSLVALVVYFYSRGIADDLNRAVSVTLPIEADRWLFGGHLPTAWLQDRLCGVPCEAASDPRWWDLVATTVYASHFVTALSVAAVLWVRDHDAWRRWMRRLLTISFSALVVYVVYPMAPPWWAARAGVLPADLRRLTGRGWEDIGLERLNLLLGGVGNKVAAMPSLHAGLALLVTLWALSRLRSPWRWLLLAYPVAMGWALVYLGEHYVVDVLAGWLLAATVHAGWTWWEARPRVRRRFGGATG